MSSLLYHYEWPVFALMVMNSAMSEVIGFPFFFVFAVITYYDYVFSGNGPVKNGQLIGTQVSLWAPYSYIYYVNIEYQVQSQLPHLKLTHSYNMFCRMSFCWSSGCGFRCIKSDCIHFGKGTWI